MKINYRLLTSFILITIIGLHGSHTIYVSGPPVYKNKKWHKQSKAIYDSLKREVLRRGDEIELFPKRIYRMDLTNTTDSSSRINKYLTKREMLSVYKNKERLLDDLIMLILRRSSQIGEPIHLIAHGMGGELLLMLKTGEYKNVIGPCIVFDGDENLYESTSGAGKLYDGELIDLALNNNGEIVINFDLLKTIGSGTSKTELAALITAIIGLIGGIIALF